MPVEHPLCLHLSPPELTLFDSNTLLRTRIPSPPFKSNPYAVSESHIDRIIDYSVRRRAYSAAAAAAAAVSSDLEIAAALKLFEP
jgi:hypothetical protein